MPVHDQPTTIRTRSGAYLDFTCPDPQTIVPEDIANHLARIPRFTGGLAIPISVAQHCLMVLQLGCMLWREQRGTEAPVLFRLHCLLHDAAEAYTGDVVKPLKVAIGESFKAIECRLWEAVCKRFSLSTETDPLVKEADKASYLLEASLTASRGDGEYCFIVAMNEQNAARAYLQTLNQLIAESPQA